MAAYDLEFLNSGQLNALLAGDHLSPFVRREVIDSLVHDGLLGRDQRVEVQVGGESAVDGAQVWVLDDTSSLNVVDATSDSALQAVVDISGTHTVTGTSADIFSGGGDWPFGDSGPHAGFDTVAGAAGDDTVTGASGHDTVTGASGHDTVTGGGGHDTAAGHGHDDGSANVSVTINGGATTVQFSDTGHGVVDLNFTDTDHHK